MQKKNSMKINEKGQIWVQERKISPIWYSFLSMVFVVTISNYLVQFPINDWLTWGSFLYPVSFLVTELTNLFFGPKTARKVVYVGFFVGVLLSTYFATPNIALASGFAFLVSQLLDIFIFTRIRQSSWWYAPLVASTIASMIDASIYWSIAFWGEGVPLWTWAAGDTAVKLLLDIVLLAPFRMIITRQKLGYT